MPVVRFQPRLKIQSKLHGGDAVFLDESTLRHLQTKLLLNDPFTEKERDILDGILSDICKQLNESQ